MTENPTPPEGLIPTAKDLRRGAAVLLAADPLLINEPALAEIITQVKQDLRITQLVVAISIVAHEVTDIGTQEKQRQLWERYHHYKEIEEHD